ncbi:MAG: hypothetical protein ACR2KJ_18440 [Jatrophihabitans sp.]
MNAGRLLANTFAEHEDPTVDTDAMLAAVHARSVEPRSRSRWPSVALASAATVVGIAIGANLMGGAGPAPSARTSVDGTGTSEPSRGETSGHTSLPEPQFELGYLPPRTDIVQTTVDKSGGTEYCLSDSSEPCAARVSSIGNPVPGTEHLTMIAGRPVQGHRTMIVVGSAASILVIVGAIDGHTIWVVGSPGRVPLPEVYRIADGVRRYSG